MTIRQHNALNSWLNAKIMELACKVRGRRNLNRLSEILCACVREISEGYHVRRQNYEDF